ncbi:MAG: 30S ribosomal protein S20 [Candidatus Dojkabacteria bacterium]
MANLKTSIKDVRQSKRKAVFNSRIKKRFKAAVKTFDKSASTEAAKAANELPRVYKLLDKAAKRGVMKKTTASRKKSRLAKKLNRLSAQDVKATAKNS